MTVVTATPGSSELEIFAFENEGGGALEGCDALTFRRGDVNADGVHDLTDAVQILARLFLGADRLACRKSANVDDNGAVNLSDPIGLLGFLFLGSPAPAAPFAGCGIDPTPDELECATYWSCP